MTIEEGDSPTPAEIPAVLQLYLEAEEDGDEDLAAFYFDGLIKGTLDIDTLFQAHPPENHPALWEAIYLTENDDWNRDYPNITLIDVLESYDFLFRGTFPAFGLLKDWVGHGYGYQGVRQSPTQSVAGKGQRKRALVPGCGRGTDAVLLAKFFGYEVVAVDVSENALAYAESLEGEINEALFYRDCRQGKNDLMKLWLTIAKGKEEKRGAMITPGPIRWREADFLSENCFRDDEKFDLIVDNYFFSALHPSLRPLWAQKMVDLLARPHGKLICRETPAEKDVCQGGPPYSAAFWFYQLHLTYPGNNKVVDYEKGVIDLSLETTSTSGPGLTQVVRCLLKDMDESGRVVEDDVWVSVWSPALGGVRPKEAREVDKTNGPSEACAKPDVTDNTAKSILKRRKTGGGHEDASSGNCPSLVNSEGSALSKSKSPSEEDDIYGYEPAANAEKRVKFSEPSP